MILEIVEYPDDRLRKKSEPIGEITQEIRQLANDMLETMYNARGVGLAAPQIGKNLRLIVFDPAWSDGPSSPRILVNPELELLGETITSEKEGCLSIPLGYRGNVKRFSKVRLIAKDIDGNDIDEILENLPAIIVQHEIDHLNGVLFIDHLPHLRRAMYETKVKKWLKNKSLV